MKPDYGMTMAEQGHWKLHVCGWGPISIDDYGRHREVCATIYTDDQPFGLMMTIVTPQSVGILLDVFTAEPDDAVEYQMKGTIGRPVVGISGEHYRPLLGRIGGHNEPPEWITEETCQTLEGLIDVATIAKRKAQYRLLLPGALPNHRQNWGLVVEDGFMPLPADLSVPQKQITLADEKRARRNAKRAEIAERTREREG